MSEDLNLKPRWERTKKSLLEFGKKGKRKVSQEQVQVTRTSNSSGDQIKKSHEKSNSEETPERDLKNESQSSSREEKTIERQGALSDQSQDFKNLLGRIHQAAEKGFDNLKQECALIELSSLDLDKKVLDFRSIKRDRTSERLLPASRAPTYVPLQTTGDGNCLFRAASILSFGHEDRHEEMRVRTVVELAINSEFYLNFKDIKRRLKAEILEIHPNSRRSTSNINHDDVKTEFKNEVLDSARNAGWASYWHLQAVATVLNRPIQSVYPDCGGREIKEFFDAVITPRLPAGDKEPLAIMWTHTSGDNKTKFIPNHFVPLIPRTEDDLYTVPEPKGDSNVPSEGDYISMEPLQSGKIPDLTDAGARPKDPRDEKAADQDVQPERQPEVQPNLQPEEDIPDSAYQGGPNSASEFNNLLQQIYQAAGQGFENLKRKCHTIELSSLHLDERVDFRSFEVDGTSQRLLPASRASRYVPLKTTGDGNCLFRAASIFAFGHENRHEEMRVRTVIELAVNSEFYLKDKDIMGRIEAQERALHPGSKRNPSQIKPDLVKTVFENDVLQTACSSSWASFWNLQALGAVLNRVVQSVYPECGASEGKRYFDAVISSRKCDQDKEPLAIMWTHTAGGDASNFIPNHFVPLISADKITSFRKDSGPTSVKKECILNILLATNAEGWNITANHQLVTELAKNPRVKVYGFVPSSSQEQRDQAKKLNIQFVNAPEEWTGFLEKELLAHPPESLHIDVLIIHSYGRELGKQAQSIKRTKKCKWIHVVHTISEELEQYKPLKKKSDSHTAEDPKELSEHELQLRLCEKADIVIAIGPKVADAYRSALNFCKKHVINLTPGIVHGLVGVRPERDDGEVFRVVIHAKYPAKYFKIKGCDIAAKAITLLQDISYRLMFIVLPTDNVEDLKCQLKAEGLEPSQFIVKPLSRSSEDKKKLLCGVDLIIMPSAEGFGNSCLCAISADLPVIISRNSGFGMALNKLPSGGKHVLDSEVPQVWADKIKEIREKGPEKRALEARQLRREYTEAYSWKDQCDGLVDKMFEMFPSKQVDKRISVEHTEEIEKTVEQEGDDEFNK